MATYIHKGVATAILKRNAFSTFLWGSPYTAARQHVTLAKLAERFAIYPECLADLLVAYGDHEDAAQMRDLLLSLKRLRRQLNDGRETMLVVQSLAIVHSWLARQYMAGLLAPEKLD